jgi:hypothetical protein
LVISEEENESEDTAEESSRVNDDDDDDDDARENEYDPSSSMSPNNETNMISNDGGDMSEATCDVNYGGDTDHTVSPVLGKHTVTDCSIKGNKYYEREPPQNLTPDMFGKSLSLSCSRICSASLQQSQDVDSGQSSSLLPGNSCHALRHTELFHH